MHATLQTEKSSFSLQCFQNKPSVVAFDGSFWICNSYFPFGKNFKVKKSLISLRDQSFHKKCCEQRNSKFWNCFGEISSKHRCIAALETLRSSSFIDRVKCITETCPLKIKGLPWKLGYPLGFGSKNKVSKATVIFGLNYELYSE